jgi:hypothetical protein
MKCLKFPVPRRIAINNTPAASNVQQLEDEGGLTTHLAIRLPRRTAAEA